MTINEYQKAALTTVINDDGSILVKARWVLGLVGESGEVAEKFKKILRDNDGEISQDKITELKKEIGDVLWYIAVLSDSLGIDLEDVAATNIAKLKSRKERGKIGGSTGDNR